MSAKGVPCFLTIYVELFEFQSTPAQNVCKDALLLTLQSMFLILRLGKQKHAALSIKPNRKTALLDFTQQRLFPTTRSSPHLTLQLNPFHLRLLLSMFSTLASLSTLVLALTGSASAQAIAAQVAALRDAATEVDRLQLLNDTDVRVLLYLFEREQITNIETSEYSSFLISIIPLLEVLTPDLEDTQSRPDLTILQL